MALDGILLNLAKKEILDCAQFGRVEKIHQPSREELVIHLRTKSGAKKLLLSVRANSPRIHFTQHAPENPATPPMFCMLMRKRLVNASLIDIRQSELDRVLYIDFDATNEIGDRVKLTLSIEIMAKHSNIILFDEEGKIIDALKRVDLSQSTVRQILPGFRYTSPPPQNKLNILEHSTDNIISQIKTFETKTLSSAILSSLQGVSPLTSRELAGEFSEHFVDEVSDTGFEELKKRIDNLRQIVEYGNAVAFMLKDETGKPVDFSFMPINQYGTKYTSEEKPSFSELLDEFYFECDRLDRTRQKAQDLVKFLGSAIARISKKISLQQAELRQCADREQLRISAELINANLYRLEKGAAFYDLENYYDENKIIRIKADPSKTPASNAQKYFKDYRKAKTAEAMLTELIEQGQNDLQYLETVADSLDRASTQAEIEEIRNELVVSGFMKFKKKNNQKQPKLLPPMEYMTTDGFRVLVGRNNMQNDKLSLKTASKSDMWLHTQKFPGSHVVIISDNKEISDDAIVEAAEIAAYHSKARDAKLVPVDYTYVKHLKKPQGAPPGKVIYHVYYSVNVTPNKEKIDKMEIK
ncbi:MAG: NFACT RNA binding domain-containing protein [Acutalibacteraceae bacterium]|nr:NFACT RNA binding domain-containing protein [Acutalibacteraceae bacterium]